MRRHRKWQAGDIDLELRREQRLVGNRQVTSCITHRDGSAKPAAEPGRRQLAGVLPIHEDRLATPGKRIGIVESEKHEAFF